MCMVKSGPRGLHGGEPLHRGLWPHYLASSGALPWLWASAPRFFPMETWEQDKKAALTSASPATELGGSQDVHLDRELGSNSRPCILGSIISQ